MVTKEKEKKEKKEEREEDREEKKKSNGCTLSFHNNYFGVFGRKKLLDAKGLFGDNVFKNPARHTIYLQWGWLRAQATQVGHVRDLN